MFRKTHDFTPSPDTIDPAELSELVQSLRAHCAERAWVVDDQGRILTSDDDVEAAVLGTPEKAGEWVVQFLRDDPYERVPFFKPGPVPAETFWVESDRSLGRTYVASDIIDEVERRFLRERTEKLRRELSHSLLGSCWFVDVRRAPSGIGIERRLSGESRRALALIEYQNIPGGPYAAAEATPDGASTHEAELTYRAAQTLVDLQEELAGSMVGDAAGPAMAEEPSALALIKLALVCGKTLELEDL